MRLYSKAVFGMRARNYLPVLCVASVLLQGGGAFAQSASSSEDSVPLGAMDCAEITIEYEEDAFLTPEEDLARMDQALNRSLNRFDACQITRTSNSGGGGGAAGGGGGVGGAGGEGSSSGQRSTASSEMTGTEKQVKVQRTSSQREQGAQALAGRGQDSASTVEGEQSTKVDERDLKAVPNGKVPEDIPSADNDSVLEAQIRKAAMNEKDPEVRARLWDEYRKYKGIEKNGG